MFNLFFQRNLVRRNIFADRNIDTENLSNPTDNESTALSFLKPQRNEGPLRTNPSSASLPSQMREVNTGQGSDLELNQINQGSTPPSPVHTSAVPFSLLEHAPTEVVVSMLAFTSQIDLVHIAASSRRHRDLVATALVMQLKDVVAKLPTSEGEDRYALAASVLKTLRSPAFRAVLSAEPHTNSTLRLKVLEAISTLISDTSREFSVREVGVAAAVSVAGDLSRLAKASEAKGVTGTEPSISDEWINPLLDIAQQLRSDQNRGTSDSQGAAAIILRLTPCFRTDEQFSKAVAVAVWTNPAIAFPPPPTRWVEGEGDSALAALLIRPGGARAAARFIEDAQSDEVLQGGETEETHGVPPLVDILTLFCHKNDLLGTAVESETTERISKGFETAMRILEFPSSGNNFATSPKLQHWRLTG